MAEGPAFVWCHYELRHRGIKKKKSDIFNQLFDFITGFEH